MHEINKQTKIRVLAVLLIHSVFYQCNDPEEMEELEQIKIDCGCWWKTSKTICRREKDAIKYVLNIRRKFLFVVISSAISNFVILTGVCK